MIKHIIAGLLISASTMLAADTLVWEWDRPTLREDGSALPAEEIKGYVIRYGNNDFSEEIQIEGADNLTAQVELEKGVYIASIATVDSDGSQGAFSPTKAFIVQDVERAKPSSPANTFRFEFVCEPEPCNLEIK